MQLFTETATGARAVETSSPPHPSQKLSWILCILYIFGFFYIEATDFKTWGESPLSPLPFTGVDDTVERLSSQLHHKEHHSGGFGHILAPIIAALFIIETRNFDSLLKQVAVLLVLIELTLWHYGYNAYANFAFIGLSIFLTIAGHKITTSNKSFDGDTRVIFSAYEAEIRRIIRVKDPRKLGQVDSILMKWKGKEEALLSEVKARYMHSNNNSNNNSISNIHSLDSAAKRKQSPGRAKDSSSSFSSTSTSSSSTSKPASTITTDPLWAYLDDPHPYYQSPPPHTHSHTHSHTNQSLVNNSIDQAYRKSQDNIPHILDQSSSNDNINKSHNNSGNSSSSGSDFKRLYSNRLNFKDVVAKSTKITTATSLPISQLTSISAQKAVPMPLPMPSSLTSSIPPRNAVSSILDAFAAYSEPAASSSYNRGPDYSSQSFKGGQNHLGDARDRRLSDISEDSNPNPSQSFNPSSATYKASASSSSSANTPLNTNRMLLESPILSRYNYNNNFNKNYDNNNNDSSSSNSNNNSNSSNNSNNRNRSGSILSDTPNSDLLRRLHMAQLNDPSFGTAADV